MKIGLNMGGSNISEKEAEKRALHALILNAKKGDWESKDRLANKFRPLLLSLAEKRSNDIETTKRLMEAGKAGLLLAAKKYKPSMEADMFRIFALDYIEASFDRSENGGGFLSRLFGKK
jgi:DNA-directed RNA polymerase specialized sigma subunit